MPSTLHEALIEMFRHRPSLAAELLTDALGVDLPDYQQVRLEPGEFTSLLPTELGHPGWTLSPLVLGPDRVPLVTDPDEATRAPEMAVLSAMAHSKHPRRRTNIWRPS